MAAGREYLPAPSAILNAFSRPLAEVRVLVVGQDPYPTPGHPMGLSFSVQPHVRPVPRSLQNIFAELADDVGAHPRERRPVRVERPGRHAPQPGAHGPSGRARGPPWPGLEGVTEAAIRALVARDAPLVAILWGRDAATLRPMLGDTPVVASAHPSPLSARRGFFGSRPFSRVNELLVVQGAAPVDWTLPRPDLPPDPPPGPAPAPVSAEQAVLAGPRRVTRQDHLLDPPGTPGRRHAAPQEQNGAGDDAEPDDHSPGR